MAYHILITTAWKDFGLVYMILQWMPCSICLCHLVLFSSWSCCQGSQCYKFQERHWFTWTPAGVDFLWLSVLRQVIYNAITVEDTPCKTCQGIRLLWLWQLIYTGSQFEETHTECASRSKALWLLWLWHVIYWEAKFEKTSAVSAFYKGVLCLPWVWQVIPHSIQFDGTSK